MHQDYQITARVQEITATFIKKNLLNEDCYPQNIQEAVVSISGKAQKRAQYQFPKAAEENDSIICEYDRVMNIYNKYHHDTRKKLTVIMEQWFWTKQNGVGGLMQSFTNVMVRLKSLFSSKASRFGEFLCFKTLIFDYSVK